MANTKISDLTANTNPSWWEELVYAYNNANWKMTLNTMKSFVESNLSWYATTSDLTTWLAWKQDTLVSWTNIKTINGNSLLWSWNIDIQWWQPTYDWSALQWPCPTWYHIPMASEWADIKTIWTTLWWWATDWTNFIASLKLPLAWERWYSGWNIANQWNNWKYWSVTADDTLASSLYVAAASISTTNWQQRARWFAIRAIKDVPIVPTISWTKMYWVSIEDGWIFWSSADWLISLSADWWTWITIADKNLWATTVWNSWDAESYANCWNYYQRWNNYWFDWSTITTSSTQVDASTYWPWNYYSSSTFIKWSEDWSSVQNDNLWWWVTWPQHWWWWVAITELTADANIWELSDWIYDTTYDLYYISWQKVPVYSALSATKKQRIQVAWETTGEKAFFVFNVWHNNTYTYSRCSFWFSKSSSEWECHRVRERDASLKEYAIATWQTDFEPIWDGSWIWLTQLVDSVEWTQTLSVSWNVYSWVTYTIIVNSVSSSYTVTLWTWVTNPLNITLPTSSNKKCIITMIATSSSTAIVSWCTMWS